MGWLAIQNFSKNQQESSVRINWLYGVYNKEHWMFYTVLFLNCVICILDVNKIYNKLCMYIYAYIFFQGASS